MSNFILLGLAPVFLACIAIEAWYLRRHAVRSYSWADLSSNAALALMQQAGSLLVAAPLLLLMQRIHAHRLFDLPAGWTTLALLVVTQDLAYYWQHRASHRIRWMWASHVTHHSSPRLNLSTAFRQSLTYPLSGVWLFSLPLVWIGFTPAQVVAMGALNLAYQFFVHTEVVRSLGWLEWIMNTPSHHRVHHARNDGYIDRNYAGIFIVWDRLFGTFTPEREPCRYGLVHPLHSHNPLRLTFHEWLAMLRDAHRAGGVRARLTQLFGPPERALGGGEASSAR
jgi:sterol desaturase/sphingolipid hydroxylase (fatty acid hydroxylase superfamily)